MPHEAMNDVSFLLTRIISVDFPTAAKCTPGGRSWTRSNRNLCCHNTCYKVTERKQSRIVLLKN
jgi:hypothetical protein